MTGLFHLYRQIVNFLHYPFLYIQKFCSNALRLQRHQDLLSILAIDFKSKTFKIKPAIALIQRGIHLWNFCNAFRLRKKSI